MKARDKHSVRLLITAGSAAAVLGTAAPAFAAPTFTGNAPADFGAGSLTIADPTGNDVGVPPAFPPGTISGNDMEDVRLSYDAGSDTLYVGINTYGIAGDVEGDGDPSHSSALLIQRGGIDYPDFGGSESFTLLIDVDEDGIYDAIAGVSALTNLGGFSVSQWVGTPFLPAFGFGAPLAGVGGSVYGSPSAGAPDIEFTITHFSAIPRSSGGDAAPSFSINAFVGSFSDDGLGEDFLPGTFSSSQVCFDSDSDGFTACNGDCNDNDPSIHPGAADACDGVDNNCDGHVDDGTPEVCDGADNDCDGSVDEGFDADGDGIPDCVDPSLCGNGIVEPDETCDDGNTVDGDACPATCFQSSSNTGATGADPHFITRDGLMFDFQATGEFIIATNGPQFVVQARLENDARSKLYSWITGVAMQVGVHRIAVYAPGLYHKLWVNNVQASILDGSVFPLSGGGQIKQQGNQMYVTWPTGEQVRVVTNSTYLSVRIMKGMNAQTTGIIGNFDGDMNNDFTTRQGARLAPPLTFATLYSTFAESWRVTAAESLFNYAAPAYSAPPAHPVPGAAGHAQDSQVQGGVPSKPFYADDLDMIDMDKAMEVCMQAGVSHPALLDACTLDVAAMDSAIEKVNIANEYAEMTPPKAIMRADGVTASIIEFNGEGGASAEAQAGGAACSYSGPQGGSRGGWLAFAGAAASAVALRRRSRKA